MNDAASVERMALEREQRITEVVGRELFRVARNRITDQPPEAHAARRASLSLTA